MPRSARRSRSATLSGTSSTRSSASSRRTSTRRGRSATSGRASSGSSARRSGRQVEDRVRIDPALACLLVLVLFGLARVLVEGHAVHAIVAAILTVTGTLEALPCAVDLALLQRGTNLGLPRLCLHVVLERDSVLLLLLGFGLLAL